MTQCQCVITMDLVPSQVSVLVRRVTEVKAATLSVIGTPLVLAMAPVLPVVTVNVTLVSMEITVPACVQVKVNVWQINVSVMLVIWVNSVRVNVMDMENARLECVCVTLTGTAVSVPSEAAPPRTQARTAQATGSVMLT